MGNQNTRLDLPQRSSYGGKSTPVNKQKFKKGGMVADMKMDKKKGIKEGSKRDKAIDRKKGFK